MKKTLTFLALGLLAGSPLSLAQDESSTEVAQPNALTEDEAKAGWVLLFDGQSLDHFRNYRGEGVSDKWQVQDGAIVLTEKGGGDLVTKDQYGAFELQIDYKISPGGNSGIMYHVQESEPNPWRTGPECQVLDNTSEKEKQKAGWLYGLYPAEQDATKPAGEWNSIRLLITPEKCEHWLNGVKYVEYVKGSEDWHERVSNTKFANFPKFGQFDHGHISLQDHDDWVAFRNIKIRALDTEKCEGEKKCDPEACDAETCDKGEDKCCEDEAAKEKCCGDKKKEEESQP